MIRFDDGRGEGRPSPLPRSSLPAPPTPMAAATAMLMSSVPPTSVHSTGAFPVAQSDTPSPAVVLTLLSLMGRFPPLLLIALLPPPRPPARAPWPDADVSRAAGDTDSPAHFSAFAALPVLALALAEGAP